MVANGTPIGETNTVPAAKIGDLCTQDGAEELAWVFTASGWEKATERFEHPSLKGYVCHFQDGVVRWVQKKSLQTYDYRQKS